jgi:hypothetical protein
VYAAGAIIVTMNVFADETPPLRSVAFYRSLRGSHRVAVAGKPRRI